MKFNLNFENINYIKIVYKNRDDETCCTKAAIKRIGEREIFACAKFDEGINIQTPQDVTLSFICDNGLYRTNTVLKFIEPDEPYVFFTLKTPDELEFQQNREYFRVKLTESAYIIHNGKIIPCKTCDISANGVRLILPEQINDLDEIVIDILFKPKDVRAKAKYVRTDDEDGIIKTSFQFIDLPESDVDIISQKCIQKQLEAKRNILM